MSINIMHKDVTGLILAGGMGRRMDGTDKGLVLLRNREMVAYVIDALQANVAEVVVNANRNADAYGKYKVRVIADSIEGYQGPLAGIEAGMAAANTSWIFTCPCDSPLQSSELLPFMWQHIQNRIAEGNDCRIGLASDGQRTHPVFSLLQTSLLPSLRAYLQSGERKIDRWFAQHPMTTIDCSQYANSFVNVNTEQEKAQLENLMSSDSNDPASIENADSKRSMQEVKPHGN